MDGKSGFLRVFLIFGNEDAGYEAGQKSSGYVRIEVRDGRGKLWAAIQNLMAENERFSYKLYLIKSQAAMTVPVCAGKLKQRQNKFELEWEFDPLNVSMSGQNIEDFNIAAVLVEYADKENANVICPLAVYKDKKAEWRNKVRELLYKSNKVVKKPEKDDVTSKYTGVTESKYIPPENDPNLNIPETYKTNQTDSTEYSAAEAGGGFAAKPDGQPVGFTANSDGQPVGFTANSDGQPDRFTANSDGQPGGFTANSDGQPDVQQQGTGNGLNTNCLYLNSNMCGMYVNTSGVNPCESCRIRTRTNSEAESRQTTGDIEKLKMELDRNFTKSDPFHSQRHDYKWWKVANPVNLNNILYQCNVRSPLLFNPVVMMAHFKYRHLIIGIYSDMVRRKEYVVCGVPGMHMVDRRPFGDMCKWVQTEGNRPKYGSFGYWIVYLDPDTGKILSLK